MPSETRRTRRITTDLCGEYLICRACEHALRGQPVAYDEELEIELVRCPECATVNAANDTRTSPQALFRRARSGLTVWLFFLVLIVVMGSCSSFGVSNWISADATQPLADSIRVAFDESLGETVQDFGAWTSIDLTWWDLNKGNFLPRSAWSDLAKHGPQKWPLLAVSILLILGLLFAGALYATKWTAVLFACVSCLVLSAAIHASATSVIELPVPQPGSAFAHDLAEQAYTWPPKWILLIAFNLLLFPVTLIARAIVRWLLSGGGPPRLMTRLKGAEQLAERAASHPPHVKP
ncbi:MAG: hypothetical protein AAF235_06455 [Planctomycetota bacterium]